MPEVEKMYVNANVEPEYDYFTAIKYSKIVKYVHLNKKELVDNIVDKIKYCKKNILIKVIRVDKDYPDFTPEKQLELVKWCCDARRRYIIYRIKSTEHFDEKLAFELNTEWEYLTKEEQEQIRSILNG